MDELIEQIDEFILDKSVSLTACIGRCEELLEHIQGWKNALKNALEEDGGDSLE